MNPEEELRSVRLQLLAEVQQRDSLLEWARAALSDIRRELRRGDLLNGIRVADTIAKTCIEKLNYPR